MGCAHPIVTYYELVIEKGLLDVALLQSDLSDAKRFVQRAINAIEGYEGAHFHTDKRVRHPLYGLGVGVLPDLNDVARANTSITAIVNRAVNLVERARDECLQAMQANNLADLKQFVNNAIADINQAIAQYAQPAAALV